MTGKMVPEFFEVVEPEKVNAVLAGHPETVSELEAIGNELMRAFTYGGKPPRLTLGFCLGRGDEYLGIHVATAMPSTLSNRAEILFHHWQAGRPYGSRRPVILVSTCMELKIC